MAHKNSQDQAVLKIINLSTDAVFSMLIGGMYDLLTDGSAYGEIDCIKEIKQELINIYINFESILTRNEEINKQELYVKKCNKFKSLQADMNIQLDAMRAYIEKKVFFFINYALRDSTELNDGLINIDIINSKIEDLKNLLGEMPIDMRVQHMTGIIKFIPLRTTKAIYYDYISKGLSAVLPYLTESESDLYVNFCRIFFNMKNMSCDEFYFSDLAAKISKLNEFDKFLLIDAEVSGETISCFQDMCAELHDLIDDAAEYVSSVFDVTNNMLILLCFADSYNYLTESNFVVKDLYYLIKEKCENLNYVFDDNLFCEKIENETLYFLDIVKKEKEKLSNKLLKAGKDRLDSEISEYSIAFNLLQKLFYEGLCSIDQILYKSVQPNLKTEEGRFASITKESASSKAEQIVDIIKSRAPDPSKQKERLERQLFLEHVPCTFLAEDLISYIKYSFNNSSGIEIRTAILEINNLLGLYRNDIYDNFGDYDEYENY